MADTAERDVRTAAKPGTACLGCRRRKLRCTREPQGCSNCSRADLPCVYPAPETGVKKKRGPYKKDKPARERHLEDLVRYLEPKKSGDVEQADVESAGEDGDGGIPALHPARVAATETCTGQAHLPEDLVRDALIALTNGRPAGDTQIDKAPPFPYRSGPDSLSSSNKIRITWRHALEYWQIFVKRVDPLTKIIHCPTFFERLLKHIEDLASLPSPEEVLLHSLCHITLSTCTEQEVRERFGNNKSILMGRFARSIETALTDVYGTPCIEQLQALMLYLIGIRRRDDATNVRALFALAVRMAQMMNLDKDTGDDTPPYILQLRRRLWWHICGQESRGAEEASYKSRTIMQEHNVPLPANLNDRDIDPRILQSPLSRHGVTDFSMVLLRMEVFNIGTQVWQIKQKLTSGVSLDAIKEEQRNVARKTEARLHKQILQYMDSSRPFDYMCAMIIHGLLRKVYLMIDFPHGIIPSNTMSLDDRRRLLRESVFIIKNHQLLAQDHRLADWAWFFRGYVQWHCLAIVVAELGWSTNKAFSDSLWPLIEPMLESWDATYLSKRDEPAWDHVNCLIARARHLRSEQQSTGLIHTGTPHPLPLSSLAPVPVQDTEWPTLSNPAPTGLTPTDTQETTAPSQPPALSFCGSMGTTSGAAMTPFDYNLDGISFDDMEGVDMEGVDFGAFDQVFGHGDWDFINPVQDGIEM